ncbi:hypothetical protein [Micromonospora sp. WMMD812]|uniref:hypothetical protein n=1 Tax=Micromonospora sp. WMMD812 TaxID=3015152 RepID=UPI00248B0ABE|nr:hypothetical protein [Micromonospora sp. WMMD812]WBB67692.1 hypothetical protein O7603_32250 [Micromonospora sp. WMMD812]
MDRLRIVGQVAIPFIWFGMVAAISLIEAPLKFRAPGITRALGLGIGRLVFRALNLAELTLLLLLTLALVGASAGAARWTLLAVTAAMLLTQAFVLRPLLDGRAQEIIAGGQPAASHLHLVYIALEAVKLVMVAWLGVSLVLRLRG